MIPEFGTLREQIHVNTYTGTLDSFLQIVEDLRRTSFRPGTYHVMHRNCNHFSDALLQEVCGARIPEWVNRAANVGCGLSPGSVTSAGSGDRGGSSFIAPGKAKPPTLAANIVEDDENLCDKKKHSSSSSSSSLSSAVSSVFSWLFGGSSTQSTPSASAPQSSSSTSHSNSNSKDKKVHTDPKKKKELTAKQKEMLEKLKANKK